MHRATPEELSKYERDGYFAREAVLTDGELVELREAAESLHERVVEAASRDEGGPVRRIDERRYQNVLGSSVQWEWRGEVAEIRSMEPYHHLDPHLDTLIDDERIWGPARAVIGAEQLSLFSDKLNFKRPRGAPFPWHQDTPYWAFQCDHLDRLVTIAVTLDDSSRENGCLSIIPGSHKHGPLPCFEDRGLVGHLYTDVDAADLEPPEALELPAGSLIYFHGEVVHGSQGNRTEDTRRVLVKTYQPMGLPRWQHDDVRPVGAPQG